MSTIFDPRETVDHLATEAMSIIIFFNRTHSLLSKSYIFISLLIKAPLGSIPELPAHFCEEIKASEGKETISSKYWLDPTANGTAVLVHCDMNLEGYIS